MAPALKTNEVILPISHVRFFDIPWTATCQASLSFTISWSLLKLIVIESVIYIQPSYPLSPSSPPALNHS